MSNSDDTIFAQMALGLVVAFIILFEIFWRWTSWNSDVMSSKPFKLDDATYQCQKTNELKYEK